MPLILEAKSLKEAKAMILKNRRYKLKYDPESGKKEESGIKGKNNYRFSDLSKRNINRKK